jgi:hypothetical protein
MKTLQISAILFLMTILFSCGQNKPITPDLSLVSDTSLWTIHNRELIDDEVVHIDAKPGDGFLKLNDLTFGNGVIELDIKGKNVPQESFVGMAFHGINDSTYDVIYFRPFNFTNPERNTHSLQYISHPVYTWQKLRREHPGVFENLLDPAPDPDDWFHVRFEINYPDVQVFVNNSTNAALSITQLSEQKEGWLGFWAGFNSDGWYRNLSITPSED